MKSPVTPQKRVLITGAAGFIGSNLVEVLLERGYSVVGIDNLSHGALRNLVPHLNHPKFIFLQEDVRSQELLMAAAQGVTIIVHLAAFKIPRYGNALETLLINTRGTENVLKAALKRGCRVIFASTSDVYGKNPFPPFHETHNLYMGQTNVKRWSYAVSKIFDEHLCFSYHEEYGLPVAIVRLFGSYGPRQNLTWWGGPQALFITAALRDQVMEIHGDGRQTRSFTYVSDTVDGIVRCMEQDGAVGEVFNIGNVKEISIVELAELIWRLAGRGEPKYRFISYQSFGKYEDVRRRVPDISKAKSLLGFEPDVHLEEGLKRTIEWQKAVLALDSPSGSGN